MGGSGGGKKGGKARGGKKGGRGGGGKCADDGFTGGEAYHAHTVIEHQEMYGGPGAMHNNTGGKGRGRDGWGRMGGEGGWKGGDSHKGGKNAKGAHGKKSARSDGDVAVEHQRAYDEEKGGWKGGNTRKGGAKGGKAGKSAYNNGGHVNFAHGDEADAMALVSQQLLQMLAKGGEGKRGGAKGGRKENGKKGGGKHAAGGARKGGSIKDFVDSGRGGAAVAPHSATRGENGTDGSKFERRKETRPDKVSPGWRKFLQAFVASECETVDIAGLNGFYRQMLHTACGTFSLSHKSSGGENARVLRISKIETDDLRTEDIHQLQDVRLRELAATSTLLESTLDAFADSGVYDAAVDDRVCAKTTRIRRRLAFAPAGAGTAGDVVRRDVPGHVKSFVAQLPAAAAKDAVVAAVRSKRVVVVSGATGSGKSTQVPQYVLDACGVEGGILVTQPRQISAISVAQRVAAERGVRVGGEVGYQVRFEAKRSQETRLLFVTTGILLRMLQGDESLASVGCVVLDEVHERGSDTDFALLVLRRLLRTKPDLKVVLMSATLSAATYMEYFKDFDASVVEIEGRTFPVHQYFLEDVAAWAGAEGCGKIDAEDEQAYREAIAYTENHAKCTEGREGEIVDVLRGMMANEVEVDRQLVVRVIEKINSAHPAGEAILVFLPGWNDIDQIAKELGRRPVGRTLQVKKCHSQLQSHEQVRVFERPGGNLRKVVLATNIAETSITIPDVVHVIDTAVAKGNSYCAWSDVSALENSIVSRANIAQRAGRAGRVRDGYCYTLIAKARYEGLPDFMPPEMKRIPLGNLVLQAQSLRLGRARDLIAEALDPPEAAGVDNAVALLQRMGALTVEHEELTSMGEVLARLPVDPLMGKMMLYGAAFRVLKPMCIIAAFLERSPYVMTPSGELANKALERRRAFAAGEFSDHMLNVRVYEAWAKLSGIAQEHFCSTNFLDAARMRRTHNFVKQLLAHMESSGFLRSASPEDHSKYANNTGLVRAVLFGGLQPQTAWVGRAISRKTGKERKDMLDVISADGKPLIVSPQSINGGRNLQGGHLVDNDLSFLVYYERLMRARSLGINECTLSGPLPVVLFASRVEWSDPTPEGTTTAAVENGWRVFRFPSAHAARVKQLRHLMAFFFSQALERVDAGFVQDAVVRALAEMVGYPISDKGTGATPATAAHVWSDDESEEADADAAVAPRVVVGDFDDGSEDDYGYYLGGDDETDDDDDEGAVEEPQSQ